MNDKFLNKISADLNKKLVDINLKYDEPSNAVKEDLNAYFPIINKIEAGWAGKWMSDDYDLYHTDFNPNERTGRNYTYEEIVSYCNLKTNKNFNKLAKWVEETHSEYEKFCTDFITELLIIKDLPKYQKESDLLTEIEKAIWFLPMDDFIKQRQPRNFIMDGRNLDKINKGYIDVPPHIRFGGIHSSELSRFIGIDNFKTNAKRLLRQIEIKSEISDYDSKIETISDNLIVLFERFHSVARQIKNRYNNRDTIKINDEYDVQDLLYALLRLYFDDIRPEEYTPSYAGSRTRMDFLLKKERTVIEVKKTRDNLKDKEVGNELILDIARYKAHPECSRLICFVYDPESKIENPRGLEDDLSNLTSDDLLVEVYIRP